LFFLLCIFHFFTACRELNNELLSEVPLAASPSSPSASLTSTTPSQSSSSLNASTLLHTDDNENDVNASEKDKEKDKEKEREKEKEKKAKLIKEHRVGSVTVHECCADYMAKCRHIALGRAKRVEVSE
jgi:hypothetical protein